MTRHSPTRLIIVAMLGGWILAQAGTADSRTLGYGSRAHPYPIRSVVKLPDGKGWKFRVNKSIPNANALVHAENMFNDPPRRGRQYFIINVTMTYTGKGSSSPFDAGSFDSVGRSNVSYDYSDDCGVTPKELDSYRKVFSGGSVSGNICFSVRRTDVSSLLLYYEPLFSLRDTQVFFALR
jgi:hypothetical protein